VGHGRAAEVKYDPEQFLESTVRVLKAYLEQEFHRSVNDGGQYVGENAYEVVSEFPGSMLDTRKMPLDRTIIHFEIDDIQSDLVGMGPNIFSQTYDETTGEVTGRTGEVHVLNMDIGVWATDRSGGTTSRLRAKQILQNCLGGTRGIVKLRDFSDGGDGMLENLGFSGGRFVLDRINDVQVFRLIEATLVLRVFSRVPLDDDMHGPAIEEIEQDPKIWIEEQGQLYKLKS
jgi:hypothetical protein